MLSTNSTLQNGRFRIIGLFGEADGGRLYDAFDEQLGQKLVLHESSANDNFADRLISLKNRQIKGVAQIREGFIEDTNAYLVTEALDGRASADEFMNDPANAIGTLLSGIRSLLAIEPNAGAFEINPQMIRRGRNGNNILLNFASGSTIGEQRSNYKLTPFAALEAVWPGLDMATQKAISNACDEESMAAIESPADEQTIVYSLGSSLYQILGGKAPLDVLVRSIEILDDNGDPLKRLSEIRPSIDHDLSDLVTHMMSLKRNERPSLSVASSLAAKLKSTGSVSVDVDPDDDLDLLEIPFDQSVRPQNAEPTVRPSVKTVNSIPPTPIVIAEEKDEPVPSFVVTEPEFDVPTFSMDDEPSPEPVVSPTPSRSYKADMPAFALEAGSAASGNGLKIAAAAAGLMIVAVIGWFIVVSGGGSGASASTAVPERITEPAAASVDSPVVSNTPMIEPASIKPEPAATVSNEPQPALDATKQPKRPVVAEVKPQTKPTPPKTEKPKKAMTVDDLLKDN